MNPKTSNSGLKYHNHKERIVMNSRRFPLPSLATVEKKLVERIQEEIEEGRREPHLGHLLPTDLPGDDLVCLVGELSLAIDPDRVRYYEHSLWPQVRQMLGVPGSLLEGSYDWAINKTREVLISEEKPWKVAADSIVAAHSKAGSARDEASDLLPLLTTRLESGFFLAGLQTLWPQQAPLLARRLWHECGLARWDEELLSRFEGSAETKQVFRDCSASLRQLLADRPARLDRERFGTLLELACEERRPNLVEVSDHHLLSGTDRDEGRPGEAPLIHDFLLQVFPEEMETGKISLIQDDSSGLLVVHWAEKAHAYGVLFLGEAEEMMEVPVADPAATESLSRLTGFWVFEATVYREEEEEFDDSAPILARFLGILPLQSLNWDESHDAANSVLRINRRDVVMDSGWDDL